MRAIGIGALLLFMTAGLLGQEAKLPQLGPTVRAVYPAGGGRGQSVEITVRGRYLQDTQQIKFFRSDIVAEITSSDFYKVVARVDIGTGVPVGTHDYRLITERGSFVGLFHVGALPQATDTGDNNVLAQAQAVTLPVTIDGQINEADYDLYRFHAKAGETVVVDLLGTRLGSQLDAKLSIFDSRGTELAFSEDFYPNGDPHIAFTPASEGDYVAQVSDAFENGSQFAVYRLSMGVLPYLYAALPAGATAGRSTEIELRGVNLDKASAITLGDSIAAPEILTRAGDRLTVRVTAPSDQAGRSVLRVSAGAEHSPVPLPFLVSELDERLSAGATSRQTPEPVQAGMAITGVLEGTRAAHFYSVNVKAGDQFVFKVDAAGFGYPLDPALTIYDDAGRVIVAQDDIARPGQLQPPAFDPHMVHWFETGGRYILKVRDTAERRHSRFVYRLSVRRAEPDFELEILQSGQTLFRNRQNNLAVRVRRLDGWNAPVDVWVDNAPPGVVTEAQTALPKNSVYKDCCADDQVVDGTDVELPAKVLGEAAPGVLPLRIRARGTFNGKMVERTVSMQHHRNLSLGPAALGDLVTSVTDLPPIVLEVPQQFSIVAGKTGKLIVTALRFDDAKEPIAIELSSPPSGVTIEGNLLAPGSGRVEIRFRVAADAKPGTYPVVLKAGRIDSPPIDLKIVAPPPEDKK